MIDRVLSLACALLLFAHGATTPALAQPRGGPGGNVARPNMDTGEFEIVRGPGPRFVVRAYTFDATDQTGWDWTGSDDLVTIFRTDEYTLVGPEYGDVDSSNPPKHYSGTDSCIMPVVDNTPSDRKWECDSRGVSAPLVFSVTLREQDSYGLLSFCANQYQESGDMRAPDADVCEDGPPHDLIGWRKFTLTLGDLLQKLPRPGDSMSFKNIIGRGCNGDCSRNYDGQYVFRYIVTRVNDAN